VDGVKAQQLSLISPIMLSAALRNRPDMDHAPPALGVLLRPAQPG
jgi:hypothetical protein